MNTSRKTTDSSAIRRPFKGVLGAGLLSALLLGLTVPPANAAMEATRIATGLNLPLYACAPPGDRTRLFIAEQHGMIKIIDLTTNTVLPTPFLDISAIAGQGQGTGILGMTFDPKYTKNGYFYVSYTTSGGGAFGGGTSYISRFKVTTDPNVADPQSEVKIISADQPQHDHNFDWIGFSTRRGDVNNLYICSGDGGGSNDNEPNHLPPDGNAQSIQTLLGKVLRIHIQPDGTYTIPPDNPFVGVSGAREEIFCRGFRNPFRASFDAKTGNLFIGDVGEHNREEISLNPGTNPGGGENFGWRIREGSIQNPAFPDDPPPPDAVDPIFDYDHSTGVCMIGGYVYHGRKVKDLKNRYVFGDAFGPNDTFAGHVWTFRYQNGTVSDFTDITTDLFPTPIGGYTLGPLTSLGEDGSGEIYLVDLNGNVFKILQSLN
jgi:glucose/arabinose dehydrogenase